MRVSILVLLLVASATGFADVEVGSAPRPEWAVELPLTEFPSDRKDEFQYGIAYLLTDRQVRKTSEGYDFARRIAYRVIDRSGLEEAARVTHEFDPTEETPNFNYVRIVRDGVVIDRLADSEVTLLRQEQGLESSLIDGNWTAVIQLEDVRVGDVIDYSISGIVESRLWPDEYFGTTQVEWSVPVAQYHFKLQLPEDAILMTRAFGTELRPTMTVEDGWQTHTMHFFDPDPGRAENYIPSDFTPFGFVTMTTMLEWSDVVQWGLPHYSIDQDLPASFTTKLDNISAEYPRPQDRAIHALRLVQQDVRYLGIEVGLGSHVPRLPVETLNNGYGDCKDKSVLLVSALNYLGIDAVPALASLGDGELLAEYPPSVHGFNHVIVGFDIDGDEHWVDPTLSHQGGLAENIAKLDYGYVLPLREGQENLVRLPAPVSDLPVFEVRESFLLPEDNDIGMSLSAEYIYRGSSADSARLRAVSIGQQQLSQNFLDYYSANYPGLAESTAFSMVDDLDANVFIYKMAYSVDAETYLESDYHDDLPLYANAVQDELPNQIEANRVAPIALPYGSSTKHVIRVETPGRSFNLPEDKTRRLGGITYQRNFEADGDDAFLLTATLVVADRSVDLEKGDAIVALADEIDDDTDLSLNIAAASRRMAKQNELGELLDKRAAAAMTKIDEQIDDEEYIDALTALNKLLRENSEKDAARGFILLKKAQVLDELDRDLAARVQYGQALDLYTPDTSGPYFRYMSLLRNQGKNREILAVMSLMLERHPDAAGGLRVSWVASLSEDLRESGMQAEATSLAIDIARAAHAADVEDFDELAWIFKDAIEGLALQEKTEEAAELVVRLRNPFTFAALLASKKTAAVWGAIEQEAGEELSKSIGSYITHTLLEANRNPDDYEALMDHVAALALAGRFEDATNFANLYVGNWAHIEAVGPEAFWFVNQAAYAYSDGGQGEEALTLMNRLVNIGVADHGGLVPMAINRASLLMQWQKFEVALQATDELESLGEEFMSDYGRMWVYSTRACSLQQLGRVDEALQVVKEAMQPLADTNHSAYIRTMLCLNDGDSAAAALVSRLQDAEEGSDLGLFFGRYKSAPSLPPFAAELQRRADELKARPEVQSAFEKVGRVIDVELIGPSSKYL